MFLTIDPGDRRPVYQQVADGIRALIAAGQLKEGMHLPPVRQIASDLGVNLNTIAVAYRELQDEGLIVIRHGSGATVASRTKTVAANPEDLRKGLRQSLAEMVLAGLPRTQIQRIVTEELKALLAGGKA